MMNTQMKSSKPYTSGSNTESSALQETPTKGYRAMVKQASLISLLASVTLIFGCGGGGGGGSSTAAPAPAASTMSELTVPDGFDYNPVEQHDLNIDISHISKNRSFVSVYSRYSERSDATFKPDYSSRLLAGSLNNGQFNSSFTAPISEENILIEIWFYDGQAPLQQVVSSSVMQVTW
ncbi:hypothetical protein F2Z80_17625 [Vibrio fortis]|uniref:Uncharacterized protein n=2 Tax=Vibrio fortis TaxID=212667 RepID=A0A5N3S2B3_9VIBR|nr:hypothetical protein [Vibrio fortis]KAB0300910.1 hypothetical protein F2Z80_17625 [Vibrio fortis]